MANIRWTGIESWKYGLTARWYVSAYYGNDVDVDGAGYYNPSTNVTGHGGPTRPFATLSKLLQDSNVTIGSNIVVDSGFYTIPVAFTKYLTFIGDGSVVFGNLSMSTGLNTAFKFNNITLISCTLGSVNTVFNFADCLVCYSQISNRIDALNTILRSSFIECSSVGTTYGSIKNSNFVSCSGFLGAAYTIMEELIFINCSNMTLAVPTPRISGVYKDYCIVIGTVKTATSINGKTTGVTIEDFKVDGNYFAKSFSEVDLFGNVSGIGASVIQLQTIFNNYFSPIYLDTWQYADLTLKPSAPDIVKFGGLNGTYIGSLPTGYRYSAFELYNTHIDNANSSNLAWDAINQGMIIAVGQDVATYRSLRISLPAAITVDPILFFANLVYNADGTAKAGVANQRIDSTPDLLPNNTLNQRVVYDYKLQYSATQGGALSTFKNFELNAPPFVDNSGNSNLDDAYTAAQRQKIVVRDFIIEFTLRRVIIE